MYTSYNTDWSVKNHNNPIRIHWQDKKEVQKPGKSKLKKEKQLTVKG
jgi:hypothetical protein